MVQGVKPHKRRYLNQAWAVGTDTPTQQLLGEGGSSEANT